MLTARRELRRFSSAFCLRVPARPRRRGKTSSRFERYPQNPQKSYTLTEQNGPWMIFAASFAGPGAAADSRRLIQELRQRPCVCRLTHTGNTTDFTDKVQGLGFDRYGRPKQMAYRQKAEFDEIAVLVGNYPTVDDPKLQKTLRTLKYCQLQSSQLTTSNPARCDLPACGHFTAD